MKPAEVPTEILAESLLAIADLKRKYLGEPMVTAYAGHVAKDAFAEDKCPLCRYQLIVFTRFPGEECECPWHWLDGHGCQVEETDDEAGFQFDYFPIPDRLARCDRWTDTITEELAERRAR